VARSRRRFWTCRKCDARVPRVLANCLTPDCTGKRPKPRKPAHHAEKDSTTYETLVERYGELCGICGAGRGTRRLHRDHDHKTGRVRGLLCFRCNAALRDYMTLDWLLNAAKYLDR
jgi:hypothetical protein